MRRLCPGVLLSTTLKCPLAPVHDSTGLWVKFLLYFLYIFTPLNLLNATPWNIIRRDLTVSPGVTPVPPLLCLESTDLAPVTSNN